ncbi:MAG: tyrosyl-tRNA synthetase [Parcubacteria group bacterium Gr01-1014_17]|nr:MAG: tyrosyl-tRNA synthetase [Parcubacteria group bacterium Gr01-1014_17]
MDEETIDPSVSVEEEEELTTDFVSGNDEEE